MLVPNRNFSSPEYRYGFQGQEKDDEVKGNGNSLNYKFRMHDPRVGRFFAVDPLARNYAWNSSYAFSENRVIDRVELEGLESWDYLDKMKHNDDDNKVVTTIKIAENGLRYVVDIIPYIFNNIEIFSKGGPSKVWEYHEDMIDDLSMGIAVDMIESKQSGEFDSGVAYLFDRVQKKEVLEAALAILISKKISTPVSTEITSSISLSRATKYAELLLDSPYARSNTKMPSSVSAVYDRVTGKIYLGESGGLKGVGITPELEAILPKASKTVWPVENCGECHALNNAFIDGAKLQNLEIHSVKITKPLKNAKGEILEQGSAKTHAPCDNCNVTTKDIRNTSKK